tara:strand:+ start:229 stop:549 length:321 start_codon:yes stop_codon:yes gene_type:complete
MPYIEKGQRELIDGPSDFTTRYGLDSFLYKMTRVRDDYHNAEDDWPGKPGTLNYMITRLVHWWLGDNPNYERYNAAIGVLECAKLELYRRKISPYEDEKIKENGDV